MLTHWDQLHSQLNKSNDFTWFSPALDAFTDVTVAVQLFIHGVNARFKGDMWMYVYI